MRSSIGPLLLLSLSSLWSACNRGALPEAADMPALTDGAHGTPDLTLLSCGGFVGSSCPAGMFCETAPGSCCCDTPAVCRPMPSGCDARVAPVCGCDGKTYNNDCARQAAGASVSYTGACAAPFPCGSSTCKAGEVCLQGCSGIGPPPPPGCQPAPPTCNGHPTCACIPPQQLQQCQDLPGGGVLLTQMGCA